MPMPLTIDFHFATLYGVEFVASASMMVFRGVSLFSNSMQTVAESVAGVVQW
jgi:hypothetical protein